VLQAGRVEPVGIVFQQQVAEAVDAAQRRAQVVGNGIAEALQFPERGLQVARALPHPVFQNGVQVADFLLGVPALGDVLAQSGEKIDPAGLVAQGQHVVAHPAHPAVRADDAEVDRIHALQIAQVG